MPRCEIIIVFDVLGMMHSQKGLEDLFVDAVSNICVEVEFVFLFAELLVCYCNILS